MYVKYFLFAILMACCARPAAVEVYKHTGISSLQSCFRGPFESYDNWISVLSKKPGFNIQRLPISKNQFNTFQSTLSCHTFDYQVGKVTVQGYLIYPANTKKPLPVVIYNRGGNTDYGMVTMGRMMNDLMPLSAAGFVVIGSQYRWSGKNIGKPEDFIADGTEDQFGGIDVEDVLSLVPLIKDLDIADSTRIGVYGSSRGGMQSYLFAKKYPEIKAMAIVAGISDVFSFRDRSEKSRFLLSQLIPDFSENEEAALKARSAIYWADELPKVPVLLIHAKDDNRVSYANSVLMSERFTQHKIPFEFITYDTGGHDLVLHKAEIQKKILGWFKTHL
ncbi:MAG: prolyl oligopeptidase family serine peptidase [Gammaproteobacteria bacterium]|jgi:dipeptidyl aminopeptidase/acylaminoacyl peptidase|nr:prolyl oligopeptidase family serine peptidase [Gammaproteobacteria bacterium]